MKGIVFEIKPLFYSCKLPVAYQIKTSSILPPPSSLLGAIYKNYVKVLDLDYSKSSLVKFLSDVIYVGLTLLPPKADLDTVIIKKFSVLLKHHRIEKDPKSREKGRRIDAMAREYVFTSGRMIGVLVAKNLDSPLIEAVESMEYLGNSESIVSVKVLERDLPVEMLDVNKVMDKNVMLQIISSDIESLPVRGVIEQCGRIPSEPWSSREAKDFCYVWNPLEPFIVNRYKPLSYKDVVSDRIQKNFMFLFSHSLGLQLIFSNHGFDCLYTKRGEKKRQVKRHG